MPSTRPAPLLTAQERTSEGVRRCTKLTRWTSGAGGGRDCCGKPRTSVSPGDSGRHARSAHPASGTRFSGWPRAGCGRGTAAGREPKARPAGTSRFRERNRDGRGRRLARGGITTLAATSCRRLAKERGDVGRNQAAVQRGGDQGQQPGIPVVLPTIQEALGATAVEVQWVIEAYTLLLAALILVGGSLGDRLGRRGAFAAGVLIFAAASVWCGLASGPGALIFSRALQGVGGALLIPNSLAIIG